MIETVVNPERIDDEPWRALFTSALFTIIAVLVALNLGTSSPEYGGMGFLIVALITIPAASQFYKIFLIEERKIKGNFFSRHKKMIAIFTFFFLGVVFMSSFSYILLGPEKGSQMFSDQTHDLTSRNIITASATATTNMFWTILYNNIRVLGLTVLFSFLFGSGAIYLITWNATVLGVLIAKIAELPASFGSPIIFNNILLDYMIALPITLIRILPHGIFEFGAYFFGAIAGGIFSVAIIREKLWSAKKLVLKDCAVYFIISIALVIVGAVVESLL